MNLYAIIGLAVIALALFLAFRQRMRPTPGAANNWKNADHLGPKASGVAAPGMADGWSSGDGGGDGGGGD
jgi:hypothetical protein